MTGVHEYGLLTSVVSTVAAHADGRKVTRVGLRAGTRSGVIEEALQAAWPLARAETCCSEATLDVEMIQAAVYCPTCDDEVDIDEFFALVCPRCGTPTADMRRGREFDIAFLDVE